MNIMLPKTHYSYRLIFNFLTSIIPILKQLKLLMHFKK